VEVLGDRGYPQDSPQHLVRHVLAHGYSHVDPQVPIVSEQLGYWGVKHEAVGVHDSGADPLMDGPGGGFPSQPPPMAIQF